ncbi:UrvD/REP family ATP-dependent DNA helicase [Brachybacterium sacelli]|uniref:DNA 3'-5' helicase n=1 Tax=Brachybacterium sacelli TaxID=173364 RepID=A0ABS4X1B5_9MICO|nr:UrvD/REP family ATP-dependent DNA helicase [Brachybacterium sacelli]MBP2382249.1 superfamily I DNA/RNA helicase/RecB family exonuclease [Brachybacterium sacelli]
MRGDGTGTGEGIRLLGPDLAALPPVLEPDTLDLRQRTARDLVMAGSDVLVHGGPGSGRTALALAAAAGAGPGTLLLAPRRPAAGRLRDALAVHGAGEVRAMTPPALGHALLRADALSRGLGEPTLVTGAEQDALLAELIADRETWALEVDPGARTLPGFRTELRDLVTRATELGLTPGDLEELGRERARPAWHDAAAILRDYLGVLDLEASAALDAGPRLDSGGLVRRAARLLEDPRTPAPFRTVVVDDAQDLTSAGIALVAALAASGATVMICSCPDAAVDTFRGALPDAADRLRTLLRRPVSEVTLDGAPAAAPGIIAAVDALRGRLPLAGSSIDSRRPRTEAGPGLAVLRAEDPLDEARLIGSALRDLHHREGVAYDDMAVVCRSGAAVADVADLLSRTGLPVRTPRRPQPLREVPAIADLLTILELGCAEEGEMVDPQVASELLRGPFGDADTLRLRRIRRLLLGARRAADPDTETPSEQLLARALVDEEVPGLPPEGARDRAAAPVHRLRAMIRSVREHREDDAEQVLWHAWDASGLAGGWRRAALGAPGDVDGARSRLAGTRLDALLELFAAAERLTDRRPGAGALDLVEQTRAQAVVEDTLAPAAAPRGRLAVLTPAQLAGEQRDTVVLARLQEGTWPDLRLRSTLFGAAELSLLGGARSGTELPADPESLRALQREQVIADELRLAVSALARARTRVLVTAVEDEQLEPSALHEALAALAEGAGEPWITLEALRQDPGPAPDVRRLVAALRRRLREDDPRRSREAALALDALARADAPGTDPERWYHQDPSSTEPLHDAGATIALSPSALERAVDCPQSWLMERAGGTRTGGPAQLIGTALHHLAQIHPHGPEGDPEDLLGELHTLLRSVPGTDTWSGRRRVRRAEDATLLLAEHLRTTGEPLAVEAPFEVDLGRVRLRGSIDRIEGDATGLRVVDLKSGRTPKSAAAAEGDLQLAAYQAAVREGALSEELGEDAPERLGGAQLVYVGTGAKKAAVRSQGALSRAEDPAWFDDLVTQVSQEVSGRQVTARLNAHCSHCAVRSSCPLQPEGDQL